MTITLLDAVKSLVPGAEVSVSVIDREITWHWPETAPVSMEQIQAEQQRLQKAYDWSEYQRNRAREYPSVEEQLDALYHAGVFPPEMADRIRAVKEKYPRPPVNYQQWPNQVVKPSFGKNVIPSNSKMTVEQWLEDQSKPTQEQWLKQQQSTVEPRQMTREEWLEEQARLK